MGVRSAPRGFGSGSPAWCWCSSTRSRAWGYWSEPRSGCTARVDGRRHESHQDQDRDMDPGQTRRDYRRTKRRKRPPPTAVCGRLFGAVSGRPRSATGARPYNWSASNSVVDAVSGTTYPPVHNEGGIGPGDRDSHGPLSILWTQRRTETTTVDARLRPLSDHNRRRRCRQDAARPGVEPVRRRRLSARSMGG